MQDKRHMNAEQIEAIRKRWHVEAMIDECLTAKLHRRAGSDYALPPLDELTNRLQHWLREETGTSLKVENLKRMVGGGSKEMFSFDRVEAGQRTALVLRMNPGESVVETHRLREFQVMKAVANAVPVPKMYFVDPDGSKLGNSALVCGFVSGVTKPSHPIGSGGAISGIGLGFPANLRGPLGDQFVDYLARIHNFDWKNADLSAFDVPKAGTREAVLWNLAGWQRTWFEDCLEEHPLFTLTSQWLEANAPVCDDVRLVHNDYRNGNFLFHEDTRKITTILDWEMAHLADIHEDLAWVLFPGFSAADENGNPLACGLVPPDEFLEKYAKASGIQPDADKLAYYRIFNTLKFVVLGTATNARAAADHQSHAEVMMNFSTGLGYSTLPLLAALLREQGAL